MVWIIISAIDMIVPDCIPARNTLLLNIDVMFVSTVDYYFYLIEFLFETVPRESCATNSLGGSLVCSESIVFGYRGLSSSRCRRRGRRRTRAFKTLHIRTVAVIVVLDGFLKEFEISLKKWFELVKKSVCTSSAWHASSHQEKYGML